VSTTAERWYKGGVGIFGKVALRKAARRREKRIELPKMVEIRHRLSAFPPQWFAVISSNRTNQNHEASLGRVKSISTL
jgi:hypothetical protein